MFYKCFYSNRAFGVELETSQSLNQQQIKKLIVSSNTPRGVAIKEHCVSKSNRDWHVKTDASCGGPGEEYGWEVASYKGSGVADLLSMASVAQRLRSAGLRVNNNCGLHVHAEVKDYTDERMGFLLARWLAIEPWLFNAVPSRRNLSCYCRPLRCARPLENKSYDAIGLWNHFKPDWDTYGRQDYRRVALNLCNYYLERNAARKQRCTVELRLPEGSLRKVDVKNWIRFFVHLVDTAADDHVLHSTTAQTLDDFFNACGLGHDGDFAILSPGLRETKLWFLKRLRKYQFSRNRQEIEAYLHRMTWPEKLAL